MVISHEQKTILCSSITSTLLMTKGLLSVLKRNYVVKQYGRRVDWNKQKMNKLNKSLLI